MTKTQLREIISNGESSSVEFKRDVVETRSLAQELVALTNFKGGVVLLGVDDDGSISGITRADIEEWVMNVCRDKIRPGLIPHFEVIREVEPGKDIAVVQVDEGWAVHYVWHNNHPYYYIRVGTQSREASIEELQRLIQQRGTFRPELRPVSGSGLVDLDIRRLRDYFSRVRQQEIPQNDDGWTSLLINTDILCTHQDAPVATVGGLLLFGKTPNRFLPQAGIDAVAYPGNEKDYAAKDRVSLRGPMVPLIGVEAGKDVMVDNGLVEQAMYFINRNIRVSATLHGAQRSEKREYPEDVLREAIVNALVHRDYMLSATNIEISLYSNRLEIISPGRLPNGITTERMRMGCRAARNQLIKDTMSDYGYLEHMGLGIPRKIIKGMREHNDTEPDLIEDHDGETFTVKLWSERMPPGRSVGVSGAA